MGTRNRQLRRGGYAMDRRTGMIVQVAEIGHEDVTIKPAYKSDGIRVDPADLVPSEDPHVWTGKQLMLALLALIISSWSAYSTFQELSGYGVDTWVAILNGALPVGLIMLFCLRSLFGLKRD